MISIILPIYNGEKYLVRCLDALVCQTYKNIEILCVDDGSVDSTHDILLRYQKKDKRIVVINKENTGVSDSRNIAIKKAKGDYICFCDCDDMYDNDYIEKMYNCIKMQKVDMVRCNYKVIDNNYKLIGCGDLTNFIKKKYKKKEIREKIIPECLEGKIPCFSYLLIIKKDLLKVEYPTDICMMEDVIFYLRLLLSINSIYFIEDKLYTIMYNENGATNNKDHYERNILNIISVNNYIKNELNKNDLLTPLNIKKIDVNNLNAIADFVFRDYLYNKSTVSLCKRINNENLKEIIDECNLEDINVQRRWILKLLKKDRYFLLKQYLFIRKIFYKIRRIK